MSFWQRLLGREPEQPSVSEFLAGREALLSTPEHFRAFAPDPSANYWPLAGRGDNSSVYAALRNTSLQLEQVSNGSLTDTIQLAPCTLLFVAEWDTYSAKEIGHTKRALDAGTTESPVYLVYVEGTSAEIRKRKAKSWYYSRAFVLAPSHAAAIGTQIGRVPFRVSYSQGGAVGSIVEGITEGAA